MERRGTTVVEGRRQWSRPVTYLRVSVTDQCSLHCLYCSPAGGEHSCPSFLSPAEIEEVVQAARRLGVTHVRLTGGEPLERRDIVEIVERIARIGIPQISLTTNGVRLAGLAEPLRRAGLSRVNVSLPHLEADGFRRITGTDLLSEALAGIRVARDAGLLPVKTNTVVLRGYNDDAVCSIAELGRREELTVRFIEYMASTGESRRELFVPAADTLKRLEARLGPLTPPAASSGQGSTGPARYYRVGSGTIVGMIAPVSEPFCQSCNRLRVTATGKLRPCLYSEAEVDLVPALRGADSALADAFRWALSLKPVRHGSRLPEAMRVIGG